MTDLDDTAVASGSTSGPPGGRLTDGMRAAATALIESLDPAVRATLCGPMDAPDVHAWTYLPGPRPGLALRDMPTRSVGLAMGLLDTALSDAGSRSARAVMQLEDVLRVLEQGLGASGWERRHSLAFWVRVLGDPADPVWSWRINGHHLLVQATVVGDEVAGTPQFFGANPARVPSGPSAGVRTLPGEEDLARELLRSLDAGQREQAVVSATAPDDIATRRDPIADLGVVPRGVPAGELDRDQRVALDRLVACYLDRLAPAAAGAAGAAARAAGTDLTFAWAGGADPGEAHYYAVAGSTFLLEYDCVQDGANHIHSVWRDITRDWGTDLLAAHHAAHGHH